MRITKRVIVGIWVLLVIFMGVLLLAYFSNRNMIKSYKKEKYEFNQLGFLGFTEPYVNPYNRGNIFYSLGDYDRAIAEYDLALSYNPPEPADCMIRVNYALALLAPIDPDKITEDNLDDVLEILDEARDILCEDGCANDKGTGHYDPAQTLKDEIDEFEEELLQQAEPTPEPTQQPSDPNDPTPTPTPTPDEGSSGEQTPEEQLQEIMQDSLEDRIGQNEDDYWTSDWNWGDQACW
ncbi:MAG: tetratricopeptide repeat protein [Clostridiales bacterium]|nr:tetratricopeptide repeat protein [Clostridiales bacterium]MBR5359132.1 tetratricopeptide repeat protein [Clostridiales bacterium]